MYVCLHVCACVHIDFKILYEFSESKSEKIWLQDIIVLLKIVNYICG